MHLPHVDRSFWVKDKQEVRSASPQEDYRQDFPKKRSGNVRIYADLSDLSKPYARKMRALNTVRDGSDPDKRKRPGY